MNNHGSLWVILWGRITWSFSHSTCVTSNRTRRPVAERGHDTVLLAGQLTRSHRDGARAVRTPRQQKHTQRCWELFTHSPKKHNGKIKRAELCRYTAKDWCSVSGRHSSLIIYIISSYIHKTWIHGLDISGHFKATITWCSGEHPSGVGYRRFTTSRKQESNRGAGNCKMNMRDRTLSP